MKAYYGSGTKNIDVTHILIANSAIGNNYNALFGDPSPGVRKVLEIFHPRVGFPVYLREDTPLKVEMEPGEPSDVEIVPDEVPIQRLNADKILLDLFPTLNRIHYQWGDRLLQGYVTKNVPKDQIEDPSWPRPYVAGDTCYIDLAEPKKGGFIDITPTVIGFGLLNQLNTLANGLMLADLTHRNIVEPRFKVSFDRLDDVPLSMLVDIPALNSDLEQLGLQSRVVPCPDGQWYDPSYNNYMWSHIGPDLARAAEVIRKEPFYLRIGCSFPIYPSGLSLEIILKMKFTKIVNDVIDYCLPIIGPNFNAVHFRFEDDWIPLSRSPFEVASQILWDRYKQEMAKLFRPEDRIYVATHLTKGKNRNDYLVQELRDLYPNIIIGIDWRNHFDLPVGREVDGLIDYLCSIRAEKFVGCNVSTFSTAIADNLIAQGKSAILVFPLNRDNPRCQAPVRP